MRRSTPAERHDRRVARVLLDHVDQLEHRGGGAASWTGIGDGHGHDDGTSTRAPAGMPDPLTWTRLLL